MNRTTLRSGAALTLALAATAATALPAAAHVRVIPEATASGGYAAITFRVPNESDTASTTELVVTLPQDRPLATVSARPVPGWTAKVTTAQLPEVVTAKDLKLTEAPRTITWTADSTAAGIADAVAVEVERLIADHRIVDVLHDLLPRHGLDVVRVDVDHEPVLQLSSPRGGLGMPEDFAAVGRGVDHLGRQHLRHAHHWLVHGLLLAIFVA